MFESWKKIFEIQLKTISRGFRNETQREKLVVLQVLESSTDVRPSNKSNRSSIIQIDHKQHKSNKANKFSINVSRSPLYKIMTLRP